MDVKFLKSPKDELKIEVNGEETILSPIKSKLLEDESVTFTGVKREHPQIKKIDFIVKGKNPSASLKKAVKAYETDLKELSKLF